MHVPWHNLPCRCLVQECGQCWSLIEEETSVAVCLSELEGLGDLEKGLRCLTKGLMGQCLQHQNLDHASCALFLFCHAKFAPQQRDGFIRSVLEQPEPDQCEILPLALVRGLILGCQTACLSPCESSCHLPLRNPEAGPAGNELSGIQRDGQALFSLLEHLERLIRLALCIVHSSQGHIPCGEWAYFTNQVGKLQATCQRLQGWSQGIPLPTYLPQTKIGGSLFRQPTSTALGAGLHHLLIGISSLSKLSLSGQEFGLVTADGQDEGLVAVNVRHLQRLVKGMASLSNLPALKVHIAEIHVQNTAREQIAFCQVFKGAK